MFFFVFLLHMHAHTYRNTKYVCTYIYVYICTWIQYNILASESVLYLLSSAHTHTLDSHHLGYVRAFLLCHRTNSQPVLDKLEHLLIAQQCPVTCTYSHPLHCIETVCLHSTLSEFVMKERERGKEAESVPVLIRMGLFHHHLHKSILAEGHRNIQVRIQ